VRQNYLSEVTTATASIFLGMTAGCARCHDHKYDPIPQRDFYRLQAFFATTQADKPVEVSRLTLDSRFQMPHWLSADRKGDRLVITGDEGSWVLVARFDSQKGSLSLDQSFHEPGATLPGISFDRQEWPHGKAGRAIVHGALFGPQ